MKSCITCQSRTQVAYSAIHLLSPGTQAEPGSVYQMLTKHLELYLIWIRTVLVWHHLSHPMTNKCYLEKDTEVTDKIQKMTGTFPATAPTEHSLETSKATLLQQRGNPRLSRTLPPCTPVLSCTTLAPHTYHIHQHLHLHPDARTHPEVIQQISSDGVGSSNHHL